MVSAAQASDGPARLTPLPKPCTPHQPPLCPGLHSTHGNCNPLDTAHIFSSSPCNGVVCIFKQYGAGAATTSKKRHITRIKQETSPPGF